MKIILAILSIVFSSFSVDRHFGEVLLLNKDTLNTPSYVVGFGPDGDTMRLVPVDSLGVTIGTIDSARAAVYADSSGVSGISDTALHTPDSVRASHVADTALHTPDSVRASHVSDTALNTPDSVRASWKSDTANVAFKALYTTHGVDSSYIPAATTDSTFGTSTAKMAGDTFQIKSDYAGTDSFQLSSMYGLSPTTFYGHCVSIVTGDVYSATLSEIYVQSGGSGNYQSVTESGNNYVNISANNTNGDIYTSNYSTGEIYKRTGGSGSFDSIYDFPHGVWSLGFDTAGNIYTGNASGGAAYVSTDDGATFDDLGVTSRSWRFFLGLSNGDMLAVASGDLYVRYATGGDFIAKGNDIGNIKGLAVDGSGNLYANTGSAPGYIYIMAGAVGSWVLFESQYKEWKTIAVLNDGTLRTSEGARLWERPGVDLKTAFHIKNGNSIFDGLVDIATPITDSIKFSNSSTGV